VFAVSHGSGGNGKLEVLGYFVRQKLSTQDGLMEEGVWLTVAVEKVDVDEMVENGNRRGSGKTGRVSKAGTQTPMGVLPIRILIAARLGSGVKSFTSGKRCRLQHCLGIHRQSALLRQLRYTNVAGIT
jgi:hypothetical protein